MNATKAKAELRQWLALWNCKAAEPQVPWEERRWRLAQLIARFLHGLKNTEGQRAAVEQLIQLVDARDEFWIETTTDIFIVMMHNRRDEWRHLDKHPDVDLAEQMVKHFQSHAPYAQQRLDQKLAEMPA